MKNHQAGQEQLNTALRRLEQYSTLSPFSRLFYRHIFDLLHEHPQELLVQAFTIFLRCETRRHQAISTIVRNGRLEVFEIIQVGRRAHYILDSLRKRLESMELSTRELVGIRNLILAECHYHLGHSREVVAALSEAVRLGARHPLVHFALGYNMYVAAMQKHTHAGRRRGELIAKDPVAFIGACHDSIAAFRRGLGDPSFDAQIHWWIGLIHEMLGERQPARMAYRCAMETDPDHFTEQSLERLERLGSIPPRRSRRERTRLGKLEPITEDEVQRARDFLESCDDFPFPTGKR